jgi:hypothetical protein
MNPGSFVFLFATGSQSKDSTEQVLKWHMANHFTVGTPNITTIKSIATGPRLAASLLTEGMRGMLGEALGFGEGPSTNSGIESCAGLHALLTLWQRTPTHANITHRTPCAAV